MATGLIATLGNSTSANYTPGSDAKVRFTWSTSGATTLNIQGVALVLATGLNGQFDVYAAAGVALTCTTGSACLCLITALEGQ